MNLPNALDNQMSGQKAASVPSVERVRVVGGPLHGNTYAVKAPLNGAVGLDSLQGTFIYRFTSVEGDEPLLQFVGPAAPVVS